MALLGGSGRYLRRTTNLPASLQAVTLCGWAKWSNANYDALALVSGTVSIYLSNSSSAVLTFGGSGIGTGTFTSPSAGQWFFWAMVGRPSSHIAYVLRLGSDASFQTVDLGATSSTTPTDVYLLDSSGGDYWESGSVACARMWAASLTAAELYQEVWSVRPRRLANLNCWSPLMADYKDYSGNGYDWTLTGSAAYADGPPVGWGAAPYIIGNPAAAGPGGRNPVSMGFDLR